MSNGYPDNAPERRIPPPLAERLPEEDEFAKKAPSQRPDMGQGAASGGAALAQHQPEYNAALRQANLMRIRGDLVGAEREARKALDADPTSGPAHEMLGDILALSDQADKALDSYRRAQSCGGSQSIDGKIGRMLLHERSDIAVLNRPALMRGQGTLLVVASLLIPGLGIALAGKTGAAAVSFLGWVITLGLMLALPPARDVLEGFLGRGRPSPSSGAEMLFLVLGIANVGFWVYSMIETSRLAKPADDNGS